MPKQTFINFTREEIDLTTYSLKVDSREDADRLLLPENRKALFELLDDQSNDLTIEEEQRIDVSEWREAVINSETPIQLTEPKPVKTYATKAEIERARDEYGNDDIEIDDSNVLTSEGENGKWIAAWVWLDNSTNEDNQND